MISYAFLRTNKPLITFAGDVKMCPVKVTSKIKK